MDFVSYTAIYRIYTCWNDVPIKYTITGYKTLSAAINDVPYTLDEIAEDEGFCFEDIWVEIDYYEDTPFGSEHIDFEDISCYIDWNGITHI